MTQIRIAPPQDADDQALVAEITGLVNTVYAEGEKGIWVEGTTRTDADEIATIIRAGQLVVARRAGSGEVLGVGRVLVLPSGEAEFGMLAAHPAHRGTGLGRDLVAFAEQWARDQGLSTMQLELLFPTEWEHPVKVFLLAWYTRIGYEQVRLGDFATDYPALSPLLAANCNFLVLHKRL